MKTPGVYIVEKNAFPNSVVEAATAIPAFIGITEKAENGSDSLSGKPWKISSMTEFYKYFGREPESVFTLSIVDKTDKADETDETDKADKADEKAIYTIAGDKKILQVVKPKNQYTLYYNMVMFFANGGGTCYIVSVGTYKQGDTLDKAKVNTALEALEKEQEITMIIVPEAVNVADCKDIQQLVLGHCGKMQNRFSIFDIQPKASENEIMSKQIETFQTNIGSNFLSYGAAYYPWLNTSVLADNDITGSIVTWNCSETVPDLKDFFNSNSQLPQFIQQSLTEIANVKKVLQEEEKDADGKVVKEKMDRDYTKEEKLQMKNDLHNALLQNWPAYQLLVKKVKDYLNLLPPSASMAGIYTMVDNTRGVWKAPANVSVNYVNSPTEVIDNAIQENLNAPMNGKAINAIRTFVGEGIKVWGARTLDGNSLDWRYINVRRTMLFLEESVKNAARAYVFEPNDANTWINMKCMIENFLRNTWKRGGLAGAVPEDAFSVHIGLGDTMTPEDILEGIMRITVLVAISHPAEFIEITFQQQMQKS